MQHFVSAGVTNVARVAVAIAPATYTDDESETCSHTITRATAISRLMTSSSLMLLQYNIAAPILVMYNKSRAVAGKPREAV